MPSAAAYGDLLLLVGKGADRAGEGLFALLAGYPDVRAQVVSAVRVSGLRWDLNLKNNLTVRLPAEQSEKALSKFDDLIANSQILDKDISVIDFRLPGRFIVQYKKPLKGIGT